MHSPRITLGAGSCCTEHSGEILYVGDPSDGVCTLIFAWHVFEDAPICVAANRDESHTRSYTPPHRWSHPAGIVVPRDDRAGGTWIGYNDEGVCVAITNRWEPGNGDRSRGLLVRDLLTASTAVDARSVLETELATTQYAPFHLVIADATQAWAVINEMNGSHSVSELEPGVHIIVNVGIDGEWFEPPERRTAGLKQAANAERLHACLREPDTEIPETWLRAAGEYLGDHQYGVCIHGQRFGTQSSSLIALGERTRYWFADGSPCETEYRLIHN